ncbi:hypothetical protein EV143_11838, partial [Flavobacterium chryseum]|uniref:hypothetical protein n=1 Tax=Flavobacterium sp. P3160 TaxID=2512113 RepID=UPI0010E93549
TLKNLSADTLNNLSAYTLNNLSAYTLNNLSAYTLNNLSADTLNNLSAYTLKNLRPEVLKEYNNFWDSIPKLDKPYTKMLNGIKNKELIHQQSTFGPLEEYNYYDPEFNVCGTPMCTAGHLVYMAGEVGFKLLKDYGFVGAATFIHRKTHPDFPVQNFGSIPQSWALSYIEFMADVESQQP